jgi:DNA modification methylase
MAYKEKFYHLLQNMFVGDSELEEKNQNLILNKNKVLEFFENLFNLNDLTSLKFQVAKLKNIILMPKNDNIGLINITNNGDTILYNRKSLIYTLNKIIASRTIARAKYYLKQVYQSFLKEKNNKINDINLARWRDYNEIITDSLWIFEKRDTTGAHLGWYWGNFIPQIPRQLMLRYTKRGDWVLDPFVGSGTTLIECQRLGRNGIGIDINEEVIKKAQELIKKEVNKYNVITKIICGDSQKIDLKKILKEFNIKFIQLAILHPPYFDIIKFSNKEEDLSNAKSLNDFLNRFGKVLDNVLEVLEPKRFLSIVIGDKYSKGEWIPLGFYVMEEALKRNLKLKSIVVKNFEETRAKRNQKELWRYRALVGGFYVFKHEYILIFQKKR